MKMTYETWVKLSKQEQESLKDFSDLTSQLVGLEGKRVEVVDIHGETRRFWVGKSTGWKPIHLEVKTTRSLGGDAADKFYKSVKVVRS